jgi:hypothetical protein
MKLAWLLTACLGCSQAVPPAVGSTQSPCPTETARPAATTEPVEAVAAAPLEPAKDAVAAPVELEGLPAPELDGSIAFAEFNESLDRAQPTWQSDPALVVARALDTAGEAHTTISIELFHESKRTVDGANVAKATIIRDGFLDDSIRGTRHRLELRLDPDRKAWRIFSASADWRCWRGHADYSTALCK